MNSIIAAVLAAGACASSLQAQTPPTDLNAASAPVLTLAEALDRAGASSPFQDAAAAGISAAAAQRRAIQLRTSPI